MDTELTPYLPSLTAIPNLVSKSGFVYAIEIAFLGNCLSTMANLIAFSMRTGTCVMYPDLMQHADLFDFAAKQYPYVFDASSKTLLDATWLTATRRFMDNAMDGYFEGYMRKLRTVPPEWLSHLGELSGGAVFLNYRQEFSDWGVYESTVARCATRGNMVIIPGAYWWQYQVPPSDCAEVVRAALPIGHHDKQLRRSERMIESASEIRIGVHVRRGDYEGYRNGEYFWTLDVYVELMQKLSASMAGRPHLFVLCSNDVWNADQLAGLCCSYEQGSTYDDFVALSKCDYVIGPPSTFANWASFLGRGKRLILTPDVLLQIDQSGLNLAGELTFPTSSGVAGDFWAT